jgi:transcriptional regulator with XRE-family HTH domain
MEPLDQLPLSIGKNVSALRKKRGLSLDKVSELTGVSKAMLGQIERGESNPSVTTLWKIANGLRVSFTSLIERQSPTISVIDLSHIRPIEEAEGDYQVFPLFPFDADKRFEIFSLTLQAGSSHVSEAHQQGVEEYVIVTQGELVITIESETYRITEGNAIHFNGDLPHVYGNKTGIQTKYIMMIFYPS